MTDTYRYNAFGVLQDSTGTSVNPFRYVGRYGYNDDGAMGGESGLSLLGVRYYSPGDGRFWSWDPVPFANLYAYCDNLPTVSEIRSGDCDGPDAATRLTKEMCRQACESLAKKAKDLNVCYKVCKGFQGKTCNAFYSYCMHLGRHRLKKMAEWCMAIYLHICFGE